MRVAVIGSGVSGLAATWLLNEFSDHEVHLYEAQDRPGGHARTVSFQKPGKPDHKPIDVDTGFIVFNPSTYPNFLKFLNSYPDLRDRIVPTEMTFSVSRDKGAFEWAGKNLFSVFAQPSRLLDQSMWRMLYDIARFNATAGRFIIQPSISVDDQENEGPELSIGEYVQREGYSVAFRDNYLIPMTAAIWSTSPDKCALDFPARTLIQFMHNHHLLQVTGKPSWLTLRGGSRIYVEKVVNALPKNRFHLSTKVKAIVSEAASSKVYLRTADGRFEKFDHVICAGHSDETLNMLRAGGGATLQEEKILGAFKWNRNQAVLHTDIQLMPARRAAWSSWNYLTSSAVSGDGEKRANVDQVALTYWMNELHHLPEKDHGLIMVTLNPPFEPRPDQVIGWYDYSHPVLDSVAIRAQGKVPTIQGVRGISFAGAWIKYGFHEDGFTSGMQAAMALQTNTLEPIKSPFEVSPADKVPTVTVAAIFFDFLEGTGLRVLLGFIFGFLLSGARFFLELVFRMDFSTLRA